MPDEVKRIRNGQKDKTPEQALSSLMRYCARAERSSGDALRLMRGWGIGEQDAAKILKRLLHDRFIDDRRFAEAYARDKTNLAGWGPYKIRTGLKVKGISGDIISEVLGGMDASLSTEKFRHVMEKKVRGLKGTVYERKAKLVRFGLSRGFDYDIVIKISDEIVND